MFLLTSTCNSPQREAIERQQTLVFLIERERERERERDFYYVFIDGLFDFAQF